MDARYLDLDAIKKQAQRKIDWDGGCALPSEVPPEVIIALCNEIKRLREQR